MNRIRKTSEPVSLHAWHNTFAKRKMPSKWHVGDVQASWCIRHMSFIPWNGVAGIGFSIHFFGKVYSRWPKIRWRFTSGMKWLANLRSTDFWQRKIVQTFMWWPRTISKLGLAYGKVPEDFFSNFFLWSHSIFQKKSEWDILSGINEHQKCWKWKAASNDAFVPSSSISFSNFFKK